jgi:hypothetical protein
MELLKNTNHRKKRYYSGEGVLVCGEEEERWLPLGNQSDDDNATRRKNQPDRVISDGDWYKPHNACSRTYGYFLQS